MKMEQQVHYLKDTSSFEFSWEEGHSGVILDDATAMRLDEVWNDYVEKVHQMSGEEDATPDFNDYFNKHPEKALLIMRQLSQRLRSRTEDYLEACRAVCDVLESEKQGKPKSRKLMDKLNEIFDAYSEYETLHGSMDTGWFIY